MASWITKSLPFRVVRTLVLIGLTGFALLQSRGYLVEQLGWPVFQILVFPVLMLAIWLGAGDWFDELREKKK